VIFSDISVIKNIDTRKEHFVTVKDISVAIDSKRKNLKARSHLHDDEGHSSQSMPLTSRVLRAFDSYSYMIVEFKDIDFRRHSHRTSLLT